MASEKQKLADQKRAEKRLALESEMKCTWVNTLVGKESLFDLISKGVDRKVLYKAKFEKFTGGVGKPSVIVTDVIDRGIVFSDGFEIRHVEPRHYNYVVAMVEERFERK